MMNTKTVKKTPVEWLCALVGAAALVIMIIYAVYTSGLSALNPLVIVLMLLTAACNFFCFAVQLELKVDVAGILEIAAAAMTAGAFVLFLKASINNLADLLNGIQIFSGATGSVEMIFTILIALLVIGVLEIVICFLKKF